MGPVDHERQHSRLARRRAEDTQAVDTRHRGGGTLQQAIFPGTDGREADAGDPLERLAHGNHLGDGWSIRFAPVVILTIIRFSLVYFCLNCLTFTLQIIDRVIPERCYTRHTYCLMTVIAMSE